MSKSFSLKEAGIPYPLGSTKTEEGWNFAVYSTEPVLSLCLAPIDAENEIVEIPLDPIKNCTGSIYHILIETEADSFYYGYRVQGKEDIVLIDPYAQYIDTGNRFGRNFWGEKKLFAVATSKAPFDWEGDALLQLPREELIIYEMHVRGFTKDSSSKTAHPGTFKGIIEKIPYLNELGVTAVELLPIQEFDEEENTFLNPKTQERLYNYWGYSPLNFFAPMQRYSSAREALTISTDLKEMVKALHKAKIEVILDIVFNHTGEGNELGKVVSWKGFAESDYYILDQNGKHMNFSGCGNTLHCNIPITQDLIIKSLRHLVIEYHIDGFRFDLASILARGRSGHPLAEPPLLERITQDPVLRYCKLIAEPWDAGGLHQVGAFYQSVYQGDARWMEWNDSFRSVVRRFIKGVPGLAGQFATKLSGSQDIYGDGGTPLNSINFVTCHDGFTLKDLVSYNEKHNIENGEDNRDGSDGNDSWNSGFEGETMQTEILLLRDRQMKNFMLALLVSQGIPLLLMGDEYGHTKRGNNNTWCHDNKLNWFLWDELTKSASFFRFYKALIAFRKSNNIFKQTSFLSSNQIDWHGTTPFHPDWSNSSLFVAYTLKGDNQFYIAFNAQANSIFVTLPSLPTNKEWVWIVNTAAQSPQDFCTPETHLQVDDKKIKMTPYSSLLLQAMEIFTPRE